MAKSRVVPKNIRFKVRARDGGDDLELAAVSLTWRQFRTRIGDVLNLKADERAELRIFAVREEGNTERLTRRTFLKAVTCYANEDPTLIATNYSTEQEEATTSSWKTSLESLFFVALSLFVFDCDPCRGVFKGLTCVAAMCAWNLFWKERREMDHIRCCCLPTCSTMALVGYVLCVGLVPRPMLLDFFVAIRNDDVNEFKTFLDEHPNFDPDKQECYSELGITCITPFEALFARSQFHGSNTFLYPRIARDLCRRYTINHTATKMRIFFKQIDETPFSQFALRRAMVAKNTNLVSLLVDECGVDQNSALQCVSSIVDKDTCQTVEVTLFGGVGKTLMGEKNRKRNIGRSISRDED